MKLARALSLALALVAVSVPSWAAQHDQHKAHHPAGSASAAASKSMPGKTTPEMARMAIEGRPYRILGACNPPLAHRALEAEPDIGLLLPCNVVVREEADGRLVVGFMEPVALMQMTSNQEVAQAAREVRERLKRMRSLGGSAC